MPVSMEGVGQQPQDTVVFQSLATCALFKRCVCGILRLPPAPPLLSLHLYTWLMLLSC